MPPTGRPPGRPTTRARNKDGTLRKKVPTQKELTYRSWKNMLLRCNYEKHVAYMQYGGRGIIVCPQWQPPTLKGFVQFVKDVGLRKNRQLTLDRINPDGNYEPGNVRWATKKDQGNNKRGTIILEDPRQPGRMIAAGLLATELGIRYQTMRYKAMGEGWWPTTSSGSTQQVPTLLTPATEDAETGDEDDDATISPDEGL